MLPVFIVASLAGTSAQPVTKMGAYNYSIDESSPLVYNGALLGTSAQPVTKMGAYDYFIDESSPLVYNGALLMFESVVRSSPSWAGYWLPAFANCSSYYRIRDMRSLGVIVNISATCEHAFGAATVVAGTAGEPDTLLVTGTPWDRVNSPATVAGGWSGPCAGSAASCSVDLFWSSSPGLEDTTWTALVPGIRLPQLGVYNNDVTPVPPAARSPWRWVMALETTSETARFMASTAADPRDTRAWQLLNDSYTVPPLPDVGSCPSLRHDGNFFYFLTGGTNIRILRSVDLRQWSVAPRNVISHVDAGDCVVAPAFFGPYIPTGVALQHLQQCGAAGNFGDDSDVDLTEWPAPFGSAAHGPATLIQYGSGDQATFGFSNLALFNGSMNAFLQSFF